MVLLSCGGSQPPAEKQLATSVDTGTLVNDTGEVPAEKQISPSHPLIRYTGRVDFSDPEAPFFSFPGVSIRVKFTGTQLRVQLDDNALRQDVDTTNYFNVIVDGGEPVLLKTTPEQKEYVLAEELDAGEHEVELFKRSESSHGADLNVGKVTVRGFTVDGNATLLAPAARKLKMEFIGDSITCGYGNELSVDDPSNNHFTTLNSNAYMAFGAIAARKLDGAYMAVAYSGRGIVRNYAGHDSPTLPDIYLHTLPDDPNAADWSPETWQPDYVVINLGTNDFSTGLTRRRDIDDLEKQYGLRYETFMQELLGFYPNATFILVIGPMLSDDFPPKYKALKRVRRTLEKLVKSFHQTGNENVHLLELPPQSPPFGEDYHPTIATHQKMADELVAFIQGL